MVDVIELSSLKLTTFSISTFQLFLSFGIKVLIYQQIRLFTFLFDNNIILIFQANFPSANNFDQNFDQLLFDWPTGP